jgi:hypothetical protein
MPWKIEYDHDLKNIEIHYEGTLTPDELLAAVHATIALAKERQTRLILTNLTKMEGGLSIVDLYDLADLLVALNLGHFKEAVLYSRLSASRQDVAFWETVCINRGLAVRVFTDRQEALEWLCGPSAV